MSDKPEYTPLDQPYVAQLLAKAPTTPGVYHVTVEHDDECPRLQGAGLCTCSPGATSLARFGALAHLQGPESDDLIQEGISHLTARALKRDGLRAFEPQSIKATAIHEAGHAILDKVVGLPPILVEIWHDKPRGGWGGHTRYSNDTFRIDILEEPLRGIEYACILLADGLAEQLLEPDHWREASSMDECLAGSSALMGVSRALSLDYSKLAKIVQTVIGHLLSSYEPVARALQRELLRLNRVRGPRLAKILDPVAPRDLAADILELYKQFEMKQTPDGYTFVRRQDDESATPPAHPDDPGPWLESAPCA